MKSLLLWESLNYRMNNYCCFYFFFTRTTTKNMTKIIQMPKAIRREKKIYSIVSKYQEINQSIYIFIKCEDGVEKKVVRCQIKLFNNKQRHNWRKKEVSKQANETKRDDMKQQQKNMWNVLRKIRSNIWKRVLRFSGNVVCV